MKKPLLVLLAGGVGLLIVVFAAVGVVSWQFATTPASNNDSEIIYEVSPGKSFKTIAEDLAKAGVIKNATAFSMFARFRGERSKLKVGEYALNTNMRPADVLAVITSGKSIAHPFTISEGLNVFEIAEAFEKAGFGKSSDFLGLVRDPAFAKSLLNKDVPSLEGYLFPETYQVTKFTTTKELIAAMVHRFQLVWGELEPTFGNQTLNPHQLVTLASIIEKETGAPQERPLISSVFYNRMVKKMKLQTDPTIIYGIADQTGVVPADIKRADILRPTRYNTYVIEGLPPGPIANPGREALLAAAHPETSEYLYFVSQNNGTHVFSKTYEAHLKAVGKFQLDPKAREGKSWRDLSKTQVQSGSSSKDAAAAPGKTVVK